MFGRFGRLSVSCVLGLILEKSKYNRSESYRLRERRRSGLIGSRVIQKEKAKVGPFRGRQVGQYWMPLDAAGARLLRSPDTLPAATVGLCGLLNSVSFLGNADN